MRALKLHLCASRFYSSCILKNSNFQSLRCIGQASKQFSSNPRLNFKQTVKPSSSKHSEDLLTFDDPDEFGLLSKTNEVFTKKYEQDEDDKKEEDLTSHSLLPYQKLSIKKYSDLIKDHLDHKRVKEAIDVLEVKMLQEDKAKPDSYIYNILISGCGQVGYTKKAFMLFNDMKRRGLKVTGGTYTSLFNACANSPWREDGLSRAKKLRELMASKLYEPNLTNYNAMIKAFGRCGDIATAFSIVDEIRSKNIDIRVHTINFLLQSCVTDVKTGYLNALITWRKMLSIRQRPNVYSFNLMLRCVKECQLGSSFNTDTVQKIIPNFAKPSLTITSGSSTAENQITETSSTAGNQTIEASSTPENRITEASSPSDESSLSTVNEMPNLLSKVPHLGSVLAIDRIESPKDKFFLIGGLDGFLQEIKVHRVIPDIKTCTQLLDLIPDTLEAEEKILDVIKTYEIKADIDFYNMLMKKRCFRRDYTAAKDVLKIVEEKNAPYREKFYLKNKILKPNIMTYGILALTCQTLEDAKVFLEEMRGKKLRVNAEIMGTLVKNAKYNNNFDYLFYVLDYCREDDVVINEMFLKHIYKYKAVCKNRVEILNEKIEKSPDEVNFIEKNETFFKFFKNWVKVMRTTENLDEYDHPWKQYRENQKETFQKPTLGKVKGIRYHKRRNVKFVKYQVKI